MLSINNVSSMNSKQWKLCVNCTLYIDTRLLRKHTISSDSSKQVHDEIVKAPVSWMFHLCNILQLVIYRFYYCSFPKQQLVRHAHQGTFHVVFKFGDKLYAIHEQALEKVLADIPFIFRRTHVIYVWADRLQRLSWRFSMISAPQEHNKSQSHHKTVRLALFLLCEYYFLDNDTVI